MEKRFYFYDLHCHTNVSPDAPGTLKSVVEMAKKRGLDGIAITDHNKIYNGPLNIDGIDIIPGEEIGVKNEDHLLAYFIKKTVEKDKELKEAVLDVRKQGGYTSLAHPLRKRDVLPEKEIFFLPDAVECGNAMDEEKQRNILSKECEELSLLRTAGSDAHTSGQVGMGVLKVPEKINKDNFLEVIKKGEVVVHSEIDEFREKNLNWKKKIKRFKNALGTKRCSIGKAVFQKLILRNYLRINNRKLRKIDINYKKKDGKEVSKK